ncbi:MAG: GIY-YIG nuclease family protein, partial [Verrucomicrobiota bacterium]
MSITVYILQSATLARHYVGISNNLNRRLTQHCNGETRTTAGAQDWQVAWSTIVPDYTVAREFEKKIKSRGAWRFLQ